MKKKQSKTIFHSFQEVAAFLGFKVRDKKQEVSQEKKDKFIRHHLCPNCKRPMTYCGGNIMACMTDGCLGIAHKIVDPITGEEKVWYGSSYHILDDKGAEIANRLLS